MMASSCLLSAIAIISVREQIFLYIAISVCLLLTIFISYRSTVPLIGLGAIAVLVYPAPIIGWLYGRDATFDSFMSHRLQNYTWPFTDTSIPKSGYSDTPIIHFHAFLTNQITTIPILPDMEGQFLITALLPILYVSITILFVYVISRRITTPELSAYGVATVIFWTPLYGQKIAFRRQSAGILFFAISAFLLYLYVYDREKRCRYLLLLLGGVSIATHHVSSVLIISLVCLVFYMEANSRNINTWVPAILISTFLVYYLLLEFGFTIIIRPVFTMFSTDKISSLIPILFGISESAGQIPTDYSVQRTEYQILTKFVGNWVYQLLLSIGIISTLLAFRDPKNEKLRKYNRWTRVVFYWGAILAIVGFTSYLTGSFAYDRVFTFFVILGGPIAVVGYQKMGYSLTSSKSTIRTLLLVLFILGVLNVPFHYLSGEQPNYEGGISSQQFGPEMYAVGEFVAINANSQRHIGDENTAQSVSIKTARNLENRPDPALDGSIPPDSIVIMSSQNEYIYRGCYSTCFVIIPENPFLALNLKNNRVYSNGGAFVWTN